MRPYTQKTCETDSGTHKPLESYSAKMPKQTPPKEFELQKVVPSRMGRAYEKDLLGSLRFLDAF